MEILETRIIPDRIGGNESPLVTVEFKCAGGESIAVTLHAGAGSRGVDMADAVGKAKALIRAAAGAERADMRDQQEAETRPPAPPHLETLTRRLASPTRRW